MFSAIAALVKGTRARLARSLRAYAARSRCTSRSPRFECAAVRPQEDRARRGIAPQPRCCRGKRIGEIVLDRDAVARQRDRRRDQFGERELCPSRIAHARSASPATVPGTPTASPLIARFLRVGVALRVEKHVRRRRRRRGLAIVDARWSSSSCARWISMKPPPPRLPARGSVTASANPTATAASTALPPRFKMSTPIARRFAFLRDDHAVLRQNRQNARLAFDDRRRRVVGARCGRDCERDGKRQREARKSKTHHSPMRWRQSISPM